MVIIPLIISGISFIVALFGLVTMWPAIINSVYELLVRIFQ